VTARLLAGLGLLAVLGCAQPPVRRELARVPVDPAPLVEWLEASNGGPPALRLQGKLRASGRGSADFGGRVVEGEGLRLDAVAGPFSTPVLSLACRAGALCEAYVPSKRTVYRGRWDGWGSWFETVLLGRVPVTGTASGGWRREDGRLVLTLEGADGWLQEVEFDGAGGPAERVVWSRWGVPRVEAVWAGRGEAGPPGFPGSVEIRVADPPGEYELRFRRVETGAEVDDALLTLPVPPDTAVVVPDGLPGGEPAQLPLWIPVPGS